MRERHYGRQGHRAIVAVPLDGSAAADADAIRELVTGADFFAFPTPSPDGSGWPGSAGTTRTCRGTAPSCGSRRSTNGGSPGKGRLVKGSLRESVLAPLWRDNASLYVATDWTGWWNIYQIGLTR